MIDRADFGTGLRAHLRLADEPPTAAPPPPGPPPPAPSEPTPEPVAAGLFDELARAERELERQARLLAAASEELDGRERALAEERERLEALRDELVVRPRPGDDVRAFLRERAEGSAEWIWRVFEEGLTAQGSDGRTDHATRLAAVRALLAEAYAEGAPREQAWEPFDELR